MPCRDRSIRPAPVAVVSLLLLAGCTVSVKHTPSPAAAPPPPATASPAPRAGGAPAPAWVELRDATFRGITESAQPVTLAGGRWEGAPFVEAGAARPSVELLESVYLSGDLNDDGDGEAVVMLAGSSGGTGVNSYVSVMGRRDGRLENLGTAPLGDRVQIRSARIDGRRILVDLVQAGPADAACCPGDLVSRTFALSGDSLIEPVLAATTGRLALAAFADREWLLRAWNVGEAAADAPPVTLTLKEGRIEGHAGCNAYFATATDGETPGAVVIGPLGSTRKICEPPLTAVEDRYLRQLEHVTRYGFMAGRLALSYQTDAGAGAMLFEARPGMSR